MGDGTPRARLEIGGAPRVTVNSDNRNEADLQGPIRFEPTRSVDEYTALGGAGYRQHPDVSFGFRIEGVSIS